MPLQLVLCEDPHGAAEAASRSEADLAIIVYPEADGERLIRYGSWSEIGPIVRDYEGADASDAISMVIQTLESGVSVYFWAPDLAGQLQSEVSDSGMDVEVSRLGVLGGDGDPMDFFKGARKPARAPRRGETVLSYCRYELLDGAEALDFGDLIRMMVTEAEQKGSRIAYVDASGRELGLHGILDRRLTQGEIQAVEGVLAKVDRHSLGKTSRPGQDCIHQILIFQIPQEVDRILEGARIPRRAT